MFYITQQNYAAVLGIGVSSASKRFRKLDSNFVRSSPRLYPLADVIRTLRDDERDVAAKLFDVATVTTDLFVGEKVLLTTTRLIDWLDSAQKARLSAAQTNFAAAVAMKFRDSSEFLLHFERLRLAILLNPDVLRWVVLGRGSLPTPDRQAGFCIANSVFEPLYTNQDCNNG